MFLERLLQINVATLTALAALLVGMGRESAVMPPAMLIAATASVWVTDFQGWFRLNRTVANLASIGALLLCLPTALELEKVALIVAVADFLVYLQAIHLFQEKSPRVYWALIRFSALQVVVAALLVQGFVFGILLIVYLFTALGALALLFLHCERTRHPPAADAAPAPGGSRWPLARENATFFGTSPGRIGVERELFWRLLRLGLATLVLSVPVFFTVPRLGRGAWPGAGVSLRYTVGFSDKVTLGELGKVIQSPEEVLRIVFHDVAGKDPYSVEGSIYLRGTVLTDYKGGRWSLPPGCFVQTRDYLDSRARPPRGEPVRQDIRIEPMYGEELFCVWPFAGDPQRADPRVYFDPRLGRLLRTSGSARTRFEFSLGTTAFHNGRQSLVYLREEWFLPGDLLQLPEQDGRVAVPALVELARQWDAQSHLPDEDHFRRAQFLEQQFRHSGRFQYSLKGQKRDRGLDPIEDFVTNNPRGHCEYFATALTLMLRSRGIPARMVVGYRTEEWNGLGRFFQVRQLHAHTWVEAHLRQEELPKDLAPDRDDPRWRDGGWLRLDPTPASAEAEVGGFWNSRAGKWLDWLDYLWKNYVVEMDRPRQRQAVYNPIVEALQDVWRTLTDRAGWKERAAAIGKALGLDRWSEGGPQSVLWSVVAALLGTALFGIVGYALYRVVLAGTSALFLRRGGKLGYAGWAKVEFFRRLEKALARRGLVRPAASTQREFAVAAGRQIAEWAGEPRLAILPVQVAEAFYQVRFGGVALDKSQADAVEQALARLERALRGRKS